MFSPEHIGLRPTTLNIVIASPHSRAWCRMTFCGISLVVILPCISACDQRRESERQASALLEAQAAQLAAEQRRREAEEAAARERARIDALVRRFSYNAGAQIMNKIGGGQDLIVRFDEWQFDAESRRIAIPMSVSFNGAIVRANNYRVSGVLTVGDDGSAPQFAREDANENYRSVESMMEFAAVGVVLLEGMEHNRQP